MKEYDYLIVGGGVVGLTIAFTLRQNFPGAHILIVEKEDAVAWHASGRNSGVLHAGFYYTADTLKARFTVAGNKALRAYCQAKGLKINPCGKLVVAQNEEELNQLHELNRRGERNGSNIRLLDQKEAEAIEPNVRTFKKALYSPDTATVDPGEVCRALYEDLKKSAVEFQFLCCFLSHQDRVAQTSKGDFAFKHLINCAGLYADKVAQNFGFGQQYRTVPFKGLYLEYKKNTTDIRTNIYPVPNLRNPFLGVHFTKTVTGKIKIGPSATPALWRENYDAWSRFRLGEFFETGGILSKLFITNAFEFRSLAFEEIKKYDRRFFINLATRLVKEIDPEGFGDFVRPGIRAQLLHLKTSKLVQDFLIEGDQHSTHILNAISPAFTCAFPFAEFIFQQHLLPKQK